MKTYKNRLQMFRDYSLVNDYNFVQDTQHLIDLDIKAKTYTDNTGAVNHYTRYQVIATSAGTYGVNGAVVAIEDAVTAVVYYYVVAERSTLLLQLV